MANEVITNLRRNIQMIGQFMIQKKLQEREGDKKLKDALKLYKEKLKIQQEYPESPATSITITPHSYTDILKAEEIKARTPKEWGKVGMAEKTGGWPFGGGGIGSQWELSPQALSAQQRAGQVLTGPGKTTQRISYGAGQMPGGVLDSQAMPQVAPQAPQVTPQVPQVPSQAAMNYSQISEEELNRLAQSGDTQAIMEARKRGYIK